MNPVWAFRLLQDFLIVKQMSGIGLVLFLSFFLLVSCKHHREIAQPIVIDYYGKYSDTMTDFQLINFVRPSGVPKLPGNYYKMGKIHAYPCFNPNNPYEIAFMEEWGGTRIYKFSFITGQKTLVYTGGYYALDWSSKGWLLFTGGDKQLWKIKDNGDSLIQLTHNGDFNNDAKWNPSGNLFAYEFQQTISICHADGTIYKVIPESPVEVNWLNDSVFVYSDYRNVFTFNVKTDKKELIRSNFEGVGMLIWANKRQTYYSLRQDKRQYYVTYDFDSRQIDTLKELYDSYSYIHLSHHPKTKKCLAVLDRRMPKDANFAFNGNLVYRRNLILMNPDGTDEKLIRIPD